MIKNSPFNHRLRLVTAENEFFPTTTTTTPTLISEEQDRLITSQNVQQKFALLPQCSEGCVEPSCEAACSWLSHRRQLSSCCTGRLLKSSAGIRQGRERTTIACKRRRRQLQPVSQYEGRRAASLSQGKWKRVHVWRSSDPETRGQDIV